MKLRLVGGVACENVSPELRGVPTPLDLPLIGRELRPFPFPGYWPPHPKAARKASAASWPRRRLVAPS